MVPTVLRTLAAVAVFAILISSTQAALIGTSTSSYEDLSGGHGPAGEVDLYPTFTADTVNGPYYRPFGRLKVSASAVGGEITVDATAAEFAGAATMLANNTNNYVGMYENWGSVFTAEATTLSGAGFNGTDFAGCTIEQMTLHWDSYVSEYTGDPENRVRTAFSYTITYYGTPEPATLSVVALGLAGMALRRKRSAVAG